MASRLLLRRFHSFLSSKLPQNSLLKEPSWPFLPSANSLLLGDIIHNRRIQTLTNQANKVAEKHETGITSKSNSASAEDNSTSVLSNLKPSSRHDRAMFFTCKVCETRSMKTFCKESYEKGVVVVRCGGCSNLHLIADNLGWFGEPGNVEQLLASRGEEVKKDSVDSLSLTLEDLAGTKA